MSDLGDTLPPIVQRTYVAAPVGDVWEALTTGTGWNAWLTTDATIDLVAERYRFAWERFGPDHVTMVLDGPIVAVDAPQRFAFDWEAGDGVTSVGFTLEARHPGTVVTVTETGYGTSRGEISACLDCAAGWGEALTLLKYHLEHGVTYGPTPAVSESG